MSNRKSGLLNKKFAFAQNDEMRPSIDENISSEEIIVAPATSRTEAPTSEKIQFSRLTTQINPKFDKQIEFLMGFLGKEKYQIIDSFIDEGIKRLGIEFPPHLK